MFFDMLQAACEPATLARQVFDLILDRAAEFFSKERASSNLVLRSPSGPAACVIDHAR